MDFVLWQIVALLLAAASACGAEIKGRSDAEKNKSSQEMIRWRVREWVI